VVRLLVVLLGTLLAAAALVALLLRH
jgi:hypothetical protein